MIMYPMYPPPDRFRRIPPVAPCGIRCCRQSGSALLVTLIFLVILTVVTVFGMRTSILELRMTGNSQYQMEALQAAQAAVDDARGQVTNNWILRPLPPPGKKTCSYVSAACSPVTFNLTSGVVPTGGTATVEIFWSSEGPTPHLPMGIASGGSSHNVYYKINSVYSESGQGARAEVDAGFFSISGL